MFKKRKVVMLPTNERSQIWMGTPALGLRHDHPGSAPFIKYFHLYFLSDEEIKKGDWMYNPEREPSIFQCVGKGSLRGWEKIIATTDTSLTEKIEMLGTGSTYIFTSDLPQPSQSFIEKFVEEYNKGNIITEVMVEYEKYIGKNYVGEFTTEKDFDYKLKINPKNNTITIRKKKDSWNRAELDPILELIREIATDDLDRVSGGIKNKAIEKLKWIEENL